MSSVPRATKTTAANTTATINVTQNQFIHHSTFGIAADSAIARPNTTASAIMTAMVAAQQKATNRMRLMSGPRG
jgi:hypothetical protein